MSLSDISTKTEEEEMVLPEDKNVIDIDLSVTAKKRFRINGDNTKILELNTSDFGVISRLRDKYPELTSLAQKASENGFEFNEEDDEFIQITKAGNMIDDIDKQMRDDVDYIFNSNVSEVCASDGTMYDLFNGKFRFEHIIEKLSALYDKEVRKEYSKMAQRLKKHTGKYTK